MSTKPQQIREDESTELELPEGWASALMGDISDVMGGGTPKSSDASNFSTNGHPWITPADLSNYEDIYISHGGRGLSEIGLRSCSAVEMPQGTVLMSSRAPIGYVAIAANSISTNQGFKSFVCSERIVPEYVYFWLKYKRDDLQEMGSGTTFLEISGSRAKEIPIVLAPFAEQQRISSSLRDLVKVTKAPIARLKRVKVILKTFRQAALAAACSGKLTEDWRKRNPDVAVQMDVVLKAEGIEDYTLPHTWTWAQVGPFYLDARYGTSVKCEIEPKNGVPVLRVPNIARGELDVQDLKYAKFSIRELDALSVKPGDVLICRTNGSLELIGKAAVIPSLEQAHAFASYLIRLRLDKAALAPQYFHLFISSRIGRDQIEERARTTAGQFNLNLEILRNLTCPFPPIEEQHEIVRRVKALFELADAIEKRVSAASLRAERLTQAVLAKAFRGELVPTEAELARREGREYESASMLLERIKAERAKTKPEKSAKRRMHAQGAS